MFSWKQGSTDGSLKLIADQLRHRPEQMILPQDFPNDLSEQIDDQNVFFLVSIVERSVDIRNTCKQLTRMDFTKY